MENDVVGARTPGCGVLYTACGAEYVRQAVVSARSIKRYSPQLPIAVFTDCTKDVPSNAPIDHLFSLEPSGSPAHQLRVDRLRALTQSPFERTLALDTDTFILDDLTEMFSVLDRFDVALCHAHSRVSRHDEMIDAGKINPAIPYAFAPINGGLILYGSGSRVTSWLNSLVLLYQEKQFPSDQVSMRELLWQTDVRYCTLPREYNFCDLADLLQWERWDFTAARPKVFHYTLHKHLDIEQIMAPLVDRLTQSGTRTWAQRVRWALARRRLRKLAK